MAIRDPRRAAIGLSPSFLVIALLKKGVMAAWQTRSDASLEEEATNEWHPFAVYCSLSQFLGNSRCTDSSGIQKRTVAIWRGLVRRKSLSQIVDGLRSRVMRDNKLTSFTVFAFSCAIVLQANGLG
jgi:hypothetical protein